MDDITTCEDLLQRITELENENAGLRQSTAMQQSSEELYRCMTDNIDLGIMIVDSAYNIVMANKASAKMLAKSADEVVGRKCYHEFKGRGISCTHCPGTKVLATGQAQEAEVETTRNGRRAILKIKAFPMLHNGVMAGFIEVVEDVTEKQQARLAIRQSEEKYRDLIENASDLIQSISPEGAVLYVNKAWKKALGYSDDEIAVLKLFDIVHPEDLVHCQESFKRLLNEGNLQNIEVRFRAKNGRTLVLEGNASCGFENGRPVSCRSIFRDVTDKKRMESRLAQLQFQHEQILNSSGEGILGIDIEGRHTFVNPAAAEMLGYRADELVGRSSHVIWHHSREDGTLYPEHECPVYMTFKTGKIYQEDQEVFWKKNGIAFPVEYLSTPILKEGKVEGAVVSFRDITERREAAAALRENEKKFRTLFETTLNPILVIDMAGNYLDCNSAALNFLECNRAELLTKNIVDYRLPDQDKTISEDLKRLWRQGVVREINFQVNGQVKTMQLAVTPVEVGGHTLVFGLGVDITLRKKAEADLTMQTRQLERAHNLLKVLFKQTGEAKREMKSKIVGEIKNLIIPAVQELGGKLTNHQAMPDVDAIRTRLEHLLSSFSQEIVPRPLGLTEKEAEIASLVKKGKTTAEIGRQLNVYPSTIKFHIKNIRKKLGLSNKDVTLHTYLLSLP